GLPGPRSAARARYPPIRRGRREHDCRRQSTGRPLRIAHSARVSPTRDLTGAATLMTRRLLVTGAGTGPAENLIRSLRAGEPALVIAGCHDDRFALRVPPPGSPRPVLRGVPRRPIRAPRLRRRRDVSRPAAFSPGLPSGAEKA